MTASAPTAAPALLASTPISAPAAPIAPPSAPTAAPVSPARSTLIGPGREYVPCPEAGGDGPALAPTQVTCNGTSPTLSTSFCTPHRVMEAEFTPLAAPSALGSSAAQSPSVVDRRPTNNDLRPRLSKRPSRFGAATVQQPSFTNHYAQTSRPAVHSASQHFVAPMSNLGVDIPPVRLPPSPAMIPSVRPTPEAPPPPPPPLPP